MIIMFISQSLSFLSYCDLNNQLLLLLFEHSDQHIKNAPLVFFTS